MTARWDKLKGRDRVRRQGNANKRTFSPFMAPLMPRRPPHRPEPSKAELRTQGKLAFQEWTGKQQSGTKS